MWLARLRSALAHAFSMAPEPLSPEDERFLDELARRVAARGLTVPAILAAEVVRYTPGLHMAFFGAAPLAEHFARFVSLGLVRGPEELRALVRISERREHLDVLIRKIEAAAGASGAPA
jgi:hypothetical protein